jgi:hypothetical protein
VGADLRWLVEEFEALWEVTGLAELFAARMAAGGRRDATGDPAGIVLTMHRSLLVGALRQEHVDDPQPVADALLGVYLSRRLAGRDVHGWAHEALDAMGLG